MDLVVFITVAIVLVLMIGFLFVALRGISRRLGDEARKNVMRLTDAYGHLIDQKEDELRSLNKSIAAQKKRLEVFKAEEPAPGVSVSTPQVAFFHVFDGEYVDENLPGYYHQIRNAFGFDKQACVKVMLEKFADKPMQGSDLYSSILDKFSFEQRFLLCTLSEDEQQTVLKEVLEGEQLSLLESYKQENEIFDVNSFFDWLETLAHSSSDSIIVRTGSKFDDFSLVDSRIRTVYDESILEGIQLAIGTKLYDFSIQNMEICK